MDNSNARLADPGRKMRIIAVLATVIGVLTLFSGGSALFGPDGAGQLAGHDVSLVVWFIFLAGFFYVAAVRGIWSGHSKRRT